MIGVSPVLLAFVVGISAAALVDRWMRRRCDHAGPPTSSFAASLCASVERQAAAGLRLFRIAWAARFALPFVLVGAISLAKPGPSFVGLLLLLATLGSLASVYALSRGLLRYRKLPASARVPGLVQVMLASLFVGALLELTIVIPAVVFLENVASARGSIFAGPSPADSRVLLERARWTGLGAAIVGTCLAGSLVFSLRRTASWLRSRHALRTANVTAGFVVVAGFLAPTVLWLAPADGAVHVGLLSVAAVVGLVTLALLFILLDDVIVELDESDSSSPLQGERRPS